ncbi:MAG: hypothetical protein ABI644_12595 [Arenimonas sp.]
MKALATKTLLLFLFLVSPCLSQSDLSIKMYGDFPKNLKVTVTQAAPLVGEHLKINVAISPSGKSNVTVPSPLLPWNGCDTPFYFVVIIEGRGFVVPQYCASPYPGPDVVLKSGHTERHTFTFNVPELKGKSPKKNIINFLWLVRHSKGNGQSGIVEIK